MQDETSLKVPINSPHEIADAIYNLSLRQKNFSVSSRQAVISSRKKQLQSDHTLEKVNETLSKIFQGIGSNNADDEVLVTYKSMLPDHFGDVEFVERVLQTQSLFFNADTSFLFDLAELNVKHGNYELAVKVYEAILEKLDRNFHAYYGLARISYLTHSDQEAMQFLKKALSIQPNHDASLRMIAYVHDRQGLSDDALTWLYKAYLCNPTETSLLLDLCQMSLRCDNNQKALKLIESIYQNSESEYQTSIVMALGHLYLRDGQYMLGQQMLDEAMHLLEAKAEHPLSKD
jgi:tetratricopeptide (TPR) repeat protein